MSSPFTLRTLIGASLLYATLLSGCAQSVRTPAPLEDQPGERGEDFKQRRLAWIEHMHRASPDVDWRAQDAAFIARRFAEREAEREVRLAAGESPLDWRVIKANVSGNWVERGSRNQAGRVTATALDAANNRLTVLSHGGNVWRANRTALDWSSPNDGARFGPSGNAGFMERLAGVSGERLLAASDSPLGVYRSDNGGVTWSVNSGSSIANPWYTMGLVSRDETQSEVYLLRVHFDSVTSNWRPHLFASVDRGTTFTSVGFVGQRHSTAIFSPRYDSSLVYLLDGNQLYTVTSGTHARVLVSTISLGFSLSGNEQTVLSGGVQSGQTFLYAFYSRPDTGTTAVFRSLDGGLTWTARSPVPTTLMTLNSAESSGNDANRAYAGGVDLYRTADGGSSWSLVNSWVDYYGSPASKLHADIPNIDVWRNAQGNERVYIATDGGLYESSDHAATVQNLNLSGMNVSQYYGSYTRRTAPHLLLAGAQDQGYQKALSPSGGAENFVQTISGDYGHLESEDDQRLWMVYPGFAMLDNSLSSGTQSGLNTWDFGANNFTGWFFIPPLAVDPLNPGRILLAGGSMSGSGQHLIDLSFNGSSFLASEVSFDFGAAVTAVAFSPDGGTRYAINDNGAFFRQVGAGAWSQRTTGLPDNHFFFGNRILADGVRANTLYVAGSGYSGPGVFVSTNNGDSFSPISNGLPSTMVFDLAMSADGEHLFAATQLGPYYYNRDTNSWQDIGQLGAPEQEYWDVDFVDAQNTARFSTYGRGIWDFVLASPAVIFRNGFE
ncbi:MAG TPA: hypothetical protein PK027_14895, partial [Aquimonas sp.]|nr:hypothetical protein [Aquimonas sp.]